MRCKAHRRNGQQCGSWAIKGAEVCRMHGGAAPQVRKAIARRKAIAEQVEQLAVWGGRRDIHPAEALMELVGAKAAEVAYWEGRVAQLEHSEMVWSDTLTEAVESTKDGTTDRRVSEARIAVALDQLHIAQRDLAAFASQSLKAGVDEAKVRLRQVQASQAVSVLRAALTDPRIGASDEVVSAVLLDAVRRMAPDADADTE